MRPMPSRSRRAGAARVRNGGPVCDELAAAAVGFRAGLANAREQDWERVATRLPGELRTARWLVCQAMHEGVHHLSDIRRIATLS